MPKSGTVQFVGIITQTAFDRTRKALKDTYSVKLSASGNVMEADLTHGIDGKDNVMFSVTKNENCSEVEETELKFQHAMSRYEIYKTKETGNRTIRVTKATIKGVNNSGILNIEFNENGVVTNKYWSSIGEKGNIDAGFVKEEAEENGLIKQGEIFLLPDQKPDEMELEFRVYENFEEIGGGIYKILNVSSLKELGMGQSRKIVLTTDEALNCSIIIADLLKEGAGGYIGVSNVLNDEDTWINY